MNNTLIFKHGWLLLKRKLYFSILQMIPSFILTLMASFFYKTYLFEISSISAFYYSLLSLYLLLTLVICLFISLVIFYKETKLELSTLNYLYWSGFSKMKLNAIVLLKWTFIIALGISISLLVFIFYQYIFSINYSLAVLARILLVSIPFNILLYTGILIALLINRPLDELKR